MSNFDSLVCNDTRLEVDNKFKTLIKALNYSNMMDDHLFMGKIDKEASYCGNIFDSQLIDYNTTIRSSMSSLDIENGTELANQSKLSPDKTSIIRNKCPTVIRRDSAECENSKFVSQQCCIMTHQIQKHIIQRDKYGYSGKTFEQFTYADSSTFKEIYNSFTPMFNEFESQSFQDIMNIKLPTAIQSQVVNLSRLMELVDMTTISGLFDAKLMHKMADIGSSTILILTALANDCSYRNIFVSIIKILCHLNLSTEQMQECRNKVTEMLRTFFASIQSFTSQSTSIGDVSATTLKSFFSGAWDLLSDEILVTCSTFVAKLAAFWATIAGGFDTSDFKIESLPTLVEFIQKNKSDATDIISTIGDAYSHIISNLDSFFKGDFSSLLMGKTSMKSFEIRVSRISQMYKLVSAGAEDVLKDEFDLSFVAFDTEVARLVKMGDRMITKAKDIQKPALKRIIDELRQIQIERIQEKAEIQTKIAALGVCFVGGSGVGKSFLTERTAKVLISAYGETPSKDLIVTGSLSEKYDSNELPRHLIIQYDDVANNSNNENYDKLLNAVNPQSRPFIKAGVEEKGKMFPGNIGCIISTNVPGLNAQKLSNCPDSICRRFLHIEVKLKEGIDICEEGTKRIDPTKAVIDGKTRMDIWEFHVYQFVTFDPLTPEMSKRGIKTWEGMQVLELKWTDKPLADQAYWDLAKFLANRARTHYDKQRSLLATLNDGSEDVYCSECNIPESICTCGTESQFLDELQVSTLQRLSDTYNTLNDYYHDSLNRVKLYAVLRVMTRTMPKHIMFTGATTIMCVPLIMSILAGYNLTIIEYITFMCIFILGIFGYVFYLCFNQVKRELSTRQGVLTFLAEETSLILRRYRETIFAGSSVILFFLAIYNVYKPKSQFLSFTESLPEQMVSSTKLSETARTSTVEQLTPHIKKDLGVLTVYHKGKIDMSLVFPIKGNMFMTVNHMLPEDGDVELMIEHEDGAVKTVARQTICQHHISRNKDKDMAIFYVPSAVPRKEYLRYFPGDVVYHTSLPVSFITKDILTKRAVSTSTRLIRKFGYGQNYVRTDKANLYCPYQYLLDFDTRSGMCMSVIMDYERSIIHGFHVAGNGKTGLMTMISHKEITAMIGKLDVFPAVSRGELYMGSNVLSHGLGFVEAESTDDSVNLPVAAHNLQLLGVLAGAGATFKDPFKKSKFYKDIVEEFGAPTHGPPQEINSVFHKRKALSKLAQPCQQFDLRSVERASKDYLDPIISLIDNMPIEVRKQIAMPLNVSQALDGIGITSLGGLNNATSNGFPFKGKKRDFLARDEFDINIAKYPRELVTKDGVDIQEVMELFKSKYLNGESSGMIFKCSMKCNELLPVKKVKARVFMGCNFPFLLLCRMYFKPFMQLVSENQHLFEAACGTDMNSIQAEEMYKHLTRFGTDHIVALDYSAFDQTMSAQVSTAASKIILDILGRLGCDSDHLKIAIGLLTDINYPVLHFFGTMIQLANSNPSGQPLTTQLNGIVNSLYLRIFFFDLYPNIPRNMSYRDVVITLTYGDDNINGVHKDYLEFNGLNIVRIGKKYGLNITMAAKDDEVVAFTNIEHSGFLKRNFRYDESIGHIVAMMEKSSINKAIHWFKKGHPQGETTAFAEKADGMMRNARSISREFFEETKGKVYRIAKKNDFDHIITWYDYDELSSFVKDQYYTNYRPGFYYPEFDFESQSVSYESTPHVLTFLSNREQALYLTTDACNEHTHVMIKSTIIHASSFRYYIEHFTAFSGIEPERKVYLLAQFITVIKQKHLFQMHEVLLQYDICLIPGIEQYPRYRGFSSQSLTSVATTSVWIMTYTIAFIICTNFVLALWDVLQTPATYSGILAKEIISNCHNLITRFVNPYFCSSSAYIQTMKYQRYLRYIRVGRADEINIEEDSMLLEINQYLVYLESMTLLTRNLWGNSAYSSCYTRLRMELTNIELERTNEIVRIQPFAICIQGPPGAGKTALAMALAKHLMEDNFTYNIKDIVILNETDEYQSEYRTNHKVVIFDDVANSNANLPDTLNPLRKMIDFINNIPKSAISPFLELKGIVKIKPKLVIATTNVGDMLAGNYSACEQSILRRFIWITVEKDPNKTVDYSQLSFEHIGIRFGTDQAWNHNKQFSELRGNTYSPSTHGMGNYHPLVEELAKNKKSNFFTYHESLDIIRTIARDHYAQQVAYVNNVNNFMFDFKSQNYEHQVDLINISRQMQDNLSQYHVTVVADYEGVISYRIKDNLRFYISNPTGVQMFKDLEYIKRVTVGGIRGTYADKILNTQPIINFPYVIRNILAYLMLYIKGDIRCATLYDTYNNMRDVIDQYFDKKFKSQAFEVGLSLSTAASIADYYTDQRLDNLRALKCASQYFAQDDVHDREYDLYLACVKNLGFSTTPILREWNMPGQPMYRSDLVLYDSFYDLFIIVEYKRELKFSKLIHQVYRSAANFVAVTHARSCLMLFYCNSTGFTYVNHTGTIANILTVLRHYKVVHLCENNMLELPSCYKTDNYNTCVEKAQKDFNICKNMQKIRTIVV